VATTRWVATTEASAAAAAAAAHDIAHRLTSRLLLLLLLLLSPAGMSPEPAETTAGLVRHIPQVSGGPA